MRFPCGPSPSAAARPVRTVSLRGGPACLRPAQPQVGAAPAPVLGEGSALKRLPTAAEGAALGVGRTLGGAVGRTGTRGVDGVALVGIAGGRSGLGQAVRLAGAPASTGTAVGRMPQPVARTAVSAAAASAGAHRWAVAVAVAVAVAKRMVRARAVAVRRRAPLPVPVLVIAVVIPLTALTSSRIRGRPPGCHPRPLSRPRPGRVACAGWSG